MHKPIALPPREASLRALRILLGTKQACDAGQSTLRRVEKWSQTKAGRTAFGEELSRETISAALAEVECHFRLPEGTLFGRKVGAKGAQTLRLDDKITEDMLGWAKEVIAAFDRRKLNAIPTESSRIPCKTLSISSENYLSVAVLPEVIKKFNDDRLKRGKAPVRFVVRELSSLNAAKDDHRRSASTFVLHSVRPAKKGERQTWTQEEGMGLVKRKIAGVKMETAIQLPDMAFVPRTIDFASLWNTAGVADREEPLERTPLTLDELGPFAVALVGDNYDDTFGTKIPGTSTPRVLVDSMAGAIRLVETERYVGIMNIYGMRLLRDSSKVVVRPIESGRPPVYLQAYCREKTALSVEAEEFIDAFFAWVWNDTPGPKPKRAAVHKTAKRLTAKNSSREGLPA